MCRKPFRKDVCCDERFGFREKIRKVNSAAIIQDLIWDENTLMVTQSEIRLDSGLSSQRSVIFLLRPVNDIAAFFV